MIRLDELKEKLVPGARWKNVGYRATLQVVKTVNRGVVAGIVDASGAVTHQCLFCWAEYFSDPTINDSIRLL